jgi:hypothetical protein
MTSEILAASGAICLSLLFSYAPGFVDFYKPLDGTRKRLLMLGLLALVSLAAFGLSCAGISTALGLVLTCDQAGALTLLRTFVAAVVTNQAAYAISPRPQNDQGQAKPASPDKPQRSTKERDRDPAPQPDYPGRAGRAHPKPKVRPRG